MTVEECKKLTLCVDCNDERCWNHGKPIADCPKPKCDRPEYAFEHCESCAFLKRFQNDMRKLYRPYRRRDE